MKYITKTIRHNFEQRYLIETTTNCSYRFRFCHVVPNCRSRIKILILAGDTAHVKVDATITIASTAPGSDAWLEIHVVTRDQATVIAAPNLEINHNAVRAGHALSTKQISLEEMFYCARGGLSPQQTEQLILNGLRQPYLTSGRIL